jgi:hypothetical protein
LRGAGEVEYDGAGRIVAWRGGVEGGGDIVEGFAATAAFWALEVKVGDVGVGFFQDVPKAGEGLHPVEIVLITRRNASHRRGGGRGYRFGFRPFYELGAVVGLPITVI